MAQSVFSAGGYHLPERHIKYPYAIVDYPWPLCGLVVAENPPIWSEEEVTCEKCTWLSKWREGHHPIEQLSLFNTLGDS